MLIQSALLALGATIVAAVPSLTVSGNQFVNPKTGDRFFVAGVAYQIGGSAGYDPGQGKDPLSNKDVCLRDAAVMQVMGFNTIRVYNLDPDLNHDECASIFNAAGIYMLLDVNSPLVGESLNSDEPWTSYYAKYSNRTFAVVEAFKNYPNTLAFFSGNEVINNVQNGATAPPYVRAVTRDLKNYIAKHSTRAIPVGYSAADVREVLVDSWNYFTCAENGDANDPSRGDILALNSYSFCGNSSFTASGYDQLVANFNSSSVPVFFSEYGCNTPSPRVFAEVPIIYGPQMTGLSGGVVYEFAQEANNYGLVNIGADGTATLMADYYTLQKQYAGVDFAQVQGTKASSSSLPPPKCDSSLISASGFSTNFTLPAVPSDTQDIIDKGVSPAPSGKIVTIDSYAVTMTVKNADGTTMKGLAVKPISDDVFNEPGTSTTGGSGSGTSTGSAPGSSSSNNAVRRLTSVVYVSTQTMSTLWTFITLGSCMRRVQKRS
ncbi:hypothetical protein P8C59_000276 [Phyllachora maydis]|uniref:1,3-beta-glucanosyltransferase n=1 Tax=Phyllachora maydis TaxID=1825666 RepID=A0AAD9HVV5_9PEZI|nr:hypothetical protein P8C59_000276 [Phyllachora maydis]